MSPNEAHRRHATFYLQMARTHHADPDGLAVDLENINAALEYCVQDGELDLVVEFIEALSLYWLQRGPWQDYLKYAQLVLGRANSLTNLHKSRLLGQLAVVSELVGNYGEATRFYTEQIDTLNENEVGDEGTLFQAQSQLSRLSRIQGREDEAEEFLQRNLIIARQRKMVKEEVDIIIDLAKLQYRRHEFKAAIDLSGEGFEKSRAIGYVAGMVTALKLKGKCYRAADELHNARASLATAFEIASNAGDQTTATELADLLSRLGAIMKRNIFISYNQADKKFAERLAADLRSKGLGVWWDEWEIKVGDSIVQKVSQAIDGSAYLAVVLSPSSIGSPWVQVELGSALMRQLSASRSIGILPLLVADCEIPALIRDLRWADFRHDYNTGLRSLLDVFVPRLDIESTATAQNG